MALTVKNRQTEDLAAEVAALAGETKTEAIRRALLERRQRLQSAQGGPRRPVRDLERFLATHVWPTIPARVLGRRVSKREREQYLGYGPDGV